MTVTPITAPITSPITFARHLPENPVLSVIGTGYLGATHAAAMAELGFTVIGVDVDAAKVEDEGLWRMPMPDAYNRQIDSMIADMKNTGGRPGGSITAALFLQRYVNGVPWAHLDIASTAWKKPSSVPTIPDGAVGYGIRLLNRMVRDKYEG